MFQFFLNRFEAQITDETKLGNLSVENPDLTQVRTIHTHSGFDSKPSSGDLHQQYDLQVEHPSDIAVIVAQSDQSPLNTIEPFGMKALRDCTADRTKDK